MKEQNQHHWVTKSSQRHAAWSTCVKSRHHEGGNVRLVERSKCGQKLAVPAGSRQVDTRPQRANPLAMEKGGPSASSGSGVSCCRCRSWRRSSRRASSSTCSCRGDSVGLVGPMTKVLVPALRYYDRASPRLPHRPSLSTPPASKAALRTRRLPTSRRQTRHPPRPQAMSPTMSRLHPPGRTLQSWLPPQSKSFSRPGYRLCRATFDLPPCRAPMAYVIPERRVAAAGTSLSATSAAPPAHAGARHSSPAPATAPFLLAKMSRQDPAHCWAYYKAHLPDMDRDLSRRSAEADRVAAAHLRRDQAEEEALRDKRRRPARAVLAAAAQRCKLLQR